MRKNPLISIVKFLFFIMLVLAVNAGELSPGIPLSLDSSQDSKLNFQYKYRPASLHLQDLQEEKKELALNGEYWEGFFSDFKNTLSSPFHWKGSDWFKAAVVTGITTGLYFNDGRIMSWVQKRRGKTTEKIAAIAEKFGNAANVFPGLVLLYGYASVFEDGKARHIALLSFKTCAATSVIVYGLKLLFHRSRPPGDNPNKWGGPGVSFNSERLSFPSGHSALAFSLAVVIASEYKGTVIPVIAYSAAVLTALSRVHDKRHWISDVFAGSVIGYFIARWIVKRNKDNQQNMAREALITGTHTHPGFFIKPFSIKRSTLGIRVFPLVDFHSLGLSMSYAF